MKKIIGTIVLAILFVLVVYALIIDSGFFQKMLLPAPKVVHTVVNLE